MKNQDTVKLIELTVDSSPLYALRASRELSARQDIDGVIDAALNHSRFEVRGQALAHLSPVTHGGVVPLCSARVPDVIALLGKLMRQEGMKGKALRILCTYDHPDAVYEIVRYWESSAVTDDNDEWLTDLMCIAYSVESNPTAARAHSLICSNNRVCPTPITHTRQDPMAVSFDATLPQE